MKRLTEGWLWFDNSDKELKEKVIEACKRYYTKFNQVPNTCYVNVKTLPEPMHFDGIRVEGWKHILIHHFFVGRLTR